MYKESYWHCDPEPDRSRFDWQLGTRAHTSKCLYALPKKQVHAFYLCILEHMVKGTLAYVKWFYFKIMMMMMNSRHQGEENACTHCLKECLVYCVPLKDRLTAQCISFVSAFKVHEMVASVIKHVSERFGIVGETIVCVCVYKKPLITAIWMKSISRFKWLFILVFLLLLQRLYSLDVLFKIPCVLTLLWLVTISTSQIT